MYAPPLPKNFFSSTPYDKLFFKNNQVINLESEELS